MYLESAAELTVIEAVRAAMAGTQPWLVDRIFSEEPRRQVPLKQALKFSRVL
jgi:hypothetical protein